MKFRVFSNTTNCLQRPKVVYPRLQQKKGEPPSFGGAPFCQILRPMPFISAQGWPKIGLLQMGGSPSFAVILGTSVIVVFCDPNIQLSFEDQQSSNVQPARNRVHIAPCCLENCTQYETKKFITMIFAAAPRIALVLVTKNKEIQRFHHLTHSNYSKRRGAPPPPFGGARFLAILAPR